MGLFSNETYSSDNNSREDGRSRFANFDNSIRNNGTVYAVYKGRVCIVSANAGLEQVDKCVVKIPKCIASNCKVRADTCIRYHMDVSKFCHSFVKILSKNNIQNMRFVNCTEAGIDCVSRFTERPRYNGISRRIKEGDTVIIEDFIAGEFCTFVERDGTIITCLCTAEIESMCHISYAEREYQSMIVGIKGVHDKKEGFKLSTPVVASVARNCGPNDPGISAINKFFESHKCSNLCQNLLTPSQIGKPRSILIPAIPYGKARDCAIAPSRKWPVCQTQEDIAPQGNEHSRVQFCQDMGGDNDLQNELASEIMIKKMFPLFLPKQPQVNMCENKLKRQQFVTDLNGNKSIEFTGNPEDHKNNNCKTKLLQTADIERTLTPTAPIESIMSCD